MSTHHPATLSVLRWFSYGHLTPGLPRDMSKEFSEVAHRLISLLPDDPETTTALRKLLEAKDAAVRSAILVSTASTQPRDDAKETNLLTARRRQLLGLAAGGLSNREIADAMGIGEATVKTTIAQIAVKLDAKNRTHAVVIAIRDGLID